jgi:hypothetical protein
MLSAFSLSSTLVNETRFVALSVVVFKSTLKRTVAGPDWTDEVLSFSDRVLLDARLGDGVYERLPLTSSKSASPKTDRALACRLPEMLLVC